jgi:hypothetical protein
MLDGGNIGMEWVGIVGGGGDGDERDEEMTYELYVGGGGGVQFT